MRFLAVALVLLGSVNTIALSLTGATSPLSGSSGRLTLADCEERVRRLPGAWESYRCFTTVARRDNRWAEAASRLDGLLAVDPENDLARFALADIEAARGGERAERLYRSAAGAFAERGDAELEVHARLQLSAFLSFRGRSSEAGEQIAQAFEAAADSGEIVLGAWVRTYEGLQAYFNADYAGAERLLKEVEEIVFSTGEHYLQSKWLSAYGSVCWATARFQESLDSYRRQAELLATVGDSYEEATARGNISLLFSKVKPQPLSPPDREKQIALIRLALDVARAGGNRPIEGKSHLYLAQVTGSAQEVRGHLREALAIFQETGNFEGRLLGMRLLADNLVLNEPRDIDTAFRLLDEALILARSRGRVLQIARSQLLRASIEWDLERDSMALRGEPAPPGSRDRAIEQSLAALDAIESIRDRQVDALARARSFIHWAFFYRRFVGNLLWPPEAQPSPQDAALAFTVIERLHARVFLDELDAAHVTGDIPHRDPATTERDRILDDIAARNRQLMRPDLSEGERQDILLELGRLEVQEAGFRGDMARNDPLFASLRQPPLPSLRDVRNAVGEDEAVLSFLLADLYDDRNSFIGGSWLLVQTRDRTNVYRLPDAGEIRESVDLLLGLISRRDGSEAQGAFRLYRDLLAEALDDLPPRIGHLVVVPDGSLHRLPIGVLRSAPDSAPLAARYRISLAPSVSAWYRWRQQDRTLAEQPGIAIADPDRGPVQSENDRPAEREAGAAFTWKDNLGGYFGPLPYARREARSLVRHLGGGSRSVVGAAATEALVKSADLERFGIIHFATHTILDDSNPTRSAVLLSPGNEKEDGLLQFREVVGLSLGGRVVVLSSCRSAAGPLLTGDGLWSPTRAFFVAGAHAVVGSLWPLRDDEAAVLFEEFYRQLGEAKTLSEALAAAVRARIRAGDPAAAWAGLVLMGDAAMVPLPSGRGGLRLGALHLALVAAIVALGAAWRGWVLYSGRISAA